MAKDWSQAVVNVLIDAGRVSLPGLGTFQLAPQEALVDPIDRKALPPDSSVTFNPNLVLDDGRLVQYLRDHSQLSVAAATQEVNNFCQQLLERIEAGENVHLPGLGHLRKDYKGSFQFAPGRNRFDKTHFGLPEIPLEPVIRQSASGAATITTLSAPGASKLATPPPITKTPGPVAPATQPAPQLRQRDEEKGRLQRIALWLLGITILLIAAGLLIDGASRNSNTLSGPDRPAVTNPTDDAFTRIPEGEQRAYEPDPATITSDNQEEDPTTTENNTSPSSNTPPVQPAVVTHSAVIAIGQYGQASNVSRAERRVEAAGYQLYSRRNGSLTRVGVAVTYETEAELQRLLEEVRRRLDIPEAFVMIKDGRSLI